MKTSIRTGFVASLPAILFSTLVFLCLQSGVLVSSLSYAGHWDSSGQYHCDNSCGRVYYKSNSNDVEGCGACNSGYWCGSYVSQNQSDACYYAQTPFLEGVCQCVKSSVPEDNTCKQKTESGYTKCGLWLGSSASGYINCGENCSTGHCVGSKNNQNQTMLGLCQPDYASPIPTPTTTPTPKCDPSKCPDKDLYSYCGGDGVQSCGHSLMKDFEFKLTLEELKRFRSIKPEKERVANFGENYLTKYYAGICLSDGTCGYDTPGFLEALKDPKARIKTKLRQQCNGIICPRPTTFCTDFDRPDDYLDNPYNGWGKLAERIIVGMAVKGYGHGGSSTVSGSNSFQILSNCYGYDNKPAQVCNDFSGCLNVNTNRVFYTMVPCKGSYCDGETGLCHCIRRPQGTSSDCLKCNEHIGCNNGIYVVTRNKLGCWLDEKARVLGTCNQGYCQ